MTVRAFENWTSDSVPCPRCRLLLPSADAPCPRCGSHAQTAQPAQRPQPGAQPHPAPPPQPNGSARPQPGTYSPPGPATYVPAGPATYLPPQPSGYLPAGPAPDPDPAFGQPRPARRGVRPGRVAVGIVFVAVLAVVGYEIHGITTSDGATTSGRPTTPTVSSAAPGGSGGIALAAIPITPAELTGWRVTATRHRSGDDGSERQMARCTGLPSTASQMGALVETNYEQGPYRISSQAQRMRTQAAVRADTAMLRNPKLAECLGRWGRRAFVKGLAGRARLRAFHLQITPGPHGGPSNVVGTAAGRIVLTTQDGRTGTLYLDTYFIVGERLESEVDFTGFGAPVDPVLQAKLVAAVAGRTASA